MDRQVTKKPDAKHQMSADVFCLFSNLKREQDSRHLLFSIWNNNKKLRLTFGVEYLVFSHRPIQWKEHKCISTFRGILIIKTPAWNDRNMKRFKCIHCNICSIHYKRVNIAKKDATYFLGKKVLEGFIWEMHKKIFVHWNWFNFIMK